ncbi:hypothetical protein [Streptomyces sp. NBC_01443]|uniref:hypothetical protein n=1 Tax=Streptomyces sp. NBC_01443 TaxID=2903868 RepID=UPI00225704FF|nr:hypothetical protein [Streptomyces sp. NBC_01443]MCX4628288.1 hypothetical protein [Streptomyces sp. NBC_01443]
MTEPDKPGGPVRQDNAAHDGGTQNITHGGNVINNNYNVYPPAPAVPASTPEAPDAPTAENRVRGWLSGRRLALVAAGTAAVIAVPVTILNLPHDPLKAENADSARSAAPGAPSSPAASPSTSASPSPSAAPASPGPAIAAAPAATPTPSPAPTLRSATVGSSPYPSKDVACPTGWLPTSVINIDMQPCTQAASGTGAAQFGVKLRNAGATQLVVTVSVKPVVSGAYGTCPLHAEPWRHVVIDPGKVWYSSFSDCSVSGSVKGHRVQSSARVAGESAGDTEVGDAKLGLGWAFDINTDGTVTKAP